MFLFEGWLVTELLTLKLLSVAIWLKSRVWLREDASRSRGCKVEGGLT